MRIGAFTVLTLAASVSVAAAQTVAGSSSASVSSDTSVSAQKSGASVDSKSSVQSSHEASVSGERKSQEQPRAHKDVKEHQKPKQQASSDAAAGTSLAAGTTITGVLVKSVDSRKARAGDQVVLKAAEDVKSEGNIVVPKGSKIYGHVTEASMKSEGKANSTLAVVFDRAELKDGTSVALNTVVQAIAQGQVHSATQADEMASASSQVGASGHHAAGASGGLLRPVGAAAGSATSNVTELGASAGSTLGSTVNSGAQTTLTSASSGVVGLQGLALNSELSNATNGSLITSTGKSVRLDSGTQFLLKVANTN
jgi:hypothetical protein